MVQYLERKTNLPLIPLGIEFLEKKLCIQSSAASRGDNRKLSQRCLKLIQFFPIFRTYARLLKRIVNCKAKLKPEEGTREI